jgi:hypothetical protein
VFDDVYEVFGVFGAFDAYEVFNTFGERTRKGKRSMVRSKGSFVDNLTVFVSHRCSTPWTTRVLDLRLNKLSSKFIPNSTIAALMSPSQVA